MQILYMRYGCLFSISSIYKKERRFLSSSGDSLKWNWSISFLFLQVAFFSRLSWFHDYFKHSLPPNSSDNSASKKKRRKEVCLGRGKEKLSLSSIILLNNKLALITGLAALQWSFIYLLQKINENHLGPTKYEVL